MMIPTPFYAREGITIYCGDCREILPQLTGIDAIVTDPPWPGCDLGDELARGENPAALMFQALVAARDIGAKRLAIQLGSQTDPRCLTSVPERWQFFRAVFMYYAWPSYRGRMLAGTEVAYLFGAPPPVRPGRRVIPGMAIDRSEDPGLCRATGGVPNGASNLSNGKHPTPRSIEHARWLARFWTAPGEMMVDPFCGGGTLLQAAHENGVHVVGIEVDERYCAIAVKRLAQRLMFTQPDPKP